MDKLTAIRIKHSDGTYSDKIHIGAAAQNIIWNDKTHTLPDVLGSVKINEGTIQQQIDELARDKIDYVQLHEQISQQISQNVEDWLDENFHPTESTVIIDEGLRISGAAADAAAAGNSEEEPFEPVTIIPEQTITVQSGMGV